MLAVLYPFSYHTQCLLDDQGRCQQQVGPANLHLLAFTPHPFFFLYPSVFCGVLFLRLLGGLQLQQQGLLGTVSPVLDLGRAGTFLSSTVAACGKQPR